MINVKLQQLLISLAAFCFFGMVSVYYGIGQDLEGKNDLNFEKLEQELLSNNVSAIYQDSFGYIWIGTFSGLHRYDGIALYDYTVDETPHGLNDNFIQEIFEDSNNDLWIRTITCISRYDRATDSFSNFEIPLNEDTEHKPKSIAEDKNGKLWVIGGEEGLFSFDPVQQRFRIEEDFTGKNLTSITIDDKNMLWIATRENGLIQFNIAAGRVEKIYTHDPEDPRSITSGAISVIQRDSDGSLWIGTNDNGLDHMIVHDGKSIFKHYQHEQNNPNSLGNNDIYVLYKDRSGNLWVGNENGGLHLYNRQENNFYRYQNDIGNPTSISGNSIYSIFEDRDSRLWVGTGLSGVNVADPYTTRFRHYNVSVNRENWLNNNTIRDFYEAENGNIWIATDGGGLNYFDRNENTFSAFMHNPDDPNSLSSNAVLDIEQDDLGRLWLGTWGGGISIMTDKKQGKFISFKKMIGNQDFPIKNVFDIHFDKQHDYIWIGTYREGLYRYDQNSEELRNFMNLSSPKILDMFEDSRGNLWISTEFGLNLMKAEDKHEGVISNYIADENDTTSLPGSFIYQVFEDRKNNIWITTSNGLARYIEETNTFKNYFEYDGLPSNDTRSIIEDENNNLWIGTLNGISKFNPETKIFTNYNRSDGLQGGEFSRNTVAKLSNGELLFGGMNGFNMFNPIRLKNNPHPPPVYLTDFKLFNRSVDINDPDSPLDRHISVTDTLMLSHTHSVITFEFVALNYSNSQQNQFAYRLEGFEDNWNYVGSQRNATYTNLSPGEYLFRVKAANNDGVWNENGVSLIIIIVPPFWQTTWFYLFTVLLIVGAVFGVFNYRVRNIKMQNKRLEQEVNNQTSELRKSNKDLKQALNELGKTREELVQSAHKAGMTEIAIGVLHNVGNILNSVNTSSALIDDTLKKSKLEGLEKANKLLRENIHDLDTFFTKNAKGKTLLEYYLKLEGPLKEEQQNIIRLSKRLTNKINLISEVIAAQQSYATASTNSGTYQLSEIVDDSLVLNAGSSERHAIKIEKNYETEAPVVCQRTMLVHVLVNIFKNAKEAMVDNSEEGKIIKINLTADDKYVYLTISDNGHGISKNNLSKVFEQGFTTKDKGHGFGLHSSANYIKDMDAEIFAESDGDGKGAKFILKFKRADLE